MAYDQAGAIPDGTDQPATGGDQSPPVGNIGDNGIDAVDAALQYGRQQVQGGGQQVAAQDTPKTRAMPASQSQINDNSPEAWGGGSVNPATQNARGALPITPPKFDPRAFMKGAQADTGNQSFAEGGAVDDPDPNEGTDPVGAIPDKVEAGPTAPSQQQQQKAASSSGDPMTDYLSGAAAASSQTVEQFKQAADPNDQLDPGQKNIAAVKAAMEQAGPKAAFGVTQFLRKGYEHEQHQARAALNGANGKPPDPDAVVQHLNAAYPFMPDGSNATFSRSDRGYRVEVSPTPGKPGQNIDLTPEQVNDWVNMGKGGQFDAVHAKKGPAALAQIAQGPGLPLQAPQGAGADQAANVKEDALQRQGQLQQIPQKPAFGTEAQARGTQPGPAPSTPLSGSNPDDIAMAKARFPSVAQYPQMLDFLQSLKAKRQEQGTTIQAAEAKQKGAIDVAGVRANATRDNSADKTTRQQMHDATVAALAMQQTQARGATAQEQGMIKIINGYRNAAGYGVVAPANVQQAEKYFASKYNAGQGGAPQAQAPDQGAPDQGAPATGGTPPAPPPQAPVAQGAPPTGANATGQANLGPVRQFQQSPPGTTIKGMTKAQDGKWYPAQQ